jgi:AraC-like DNA-binding protein
MDPLTQTIELLRPRGFSWKAGQAAGNWAIRFPGHTGVAFCVIAAGSCRLGLPGQSPHLLDGGDYVLLAAPPPWTLSGGARTVAIDFQPGAGKQGRLTGWLGRRDATPVTRFLGGHFRFDDASAALVTSLVPRVVKVRSSEPGAGRLRGVLALIDDEATADRPGRAVVLERLLEIMLVEAIRHGTSLVGEVRQGLVRGLADPSIGKALRAVHGEIGRRWTVAQLAAVAGASRSVFAERFTRIVGLAPIDYLLHWRMARARQALRAGTGLAEVAVACGYSSPSAFSTAFRRIVGCSPGAYAAGAPRPA